MDLGGTTTAQLTSLYNFFSSQRAVQPSRRLYFSHKLEKFQDKLGKKAVLV
jgi:hypothetical protein